MSTVWNLTDLASLEEPVLSAYATPLKKRRTKQPGIMLKVIAVATVATTMVVAARTNTPIFTVPYSLTTAAHSGIEEKPPLEAMFTRHFDADWSEAKERALLTGLADQRKVFVKSELEDQTIESIYFNQQEEVGPQTPKLTKNQIANIVKKNKLV